MSLSRSSKDILSGTSGGIAQVFVGQPLDIIKVRLQTAQKGTYTGLVDCASQILKAEGPLGFYRVRFNSQESKVRSTLLNRLLPLQGTVTPLLGVGACVSIQFGVVEAVKRHFDGMNRRSGHEGNLTSWQLYQAGSAAGIANSFVAGV
jgi:solute carrier family 25 carnitine/acylcarnitine transporter 20/29